MLFMRSCRTTSEAVAACCIALQRDQSPIDTYRVFAASIQANEVFCRMQSAPGSQRSARAPSRSQDNMSSRVFAPC